MLSLLSWAVLGPFALFFLAWCFGAYWPAAALVGAAAFGLYRLACKARQPPP